MSDSDLILCDTDERGVSQLKLNRAEKHNAFDDTLINAITHSLNALSDLGHTRVLVLGSMGKSFSAGGDLEWMKKTAAYSPEENQADAERLAGMLTALNNFPAPVIARVQGAAFGGGVGLVACCDIAVASTAAKFSLSEVRLGLIPATISPFVIDAIGARQARRYFLSAERFDAETAKHIGLVHEVVDPEQLDTQVDALVTQLLTCGPAAQKQAKQLIRDLQYSTRDETLAVETSRRIAMVRASAEGQEGVGAFLEKREPDWIKP
ncbi:MAG: enoyl-CoA hydratase/isomerase family protein [Granulosicoccus sp.]|nr:enoyl-CoA hydratase/isomerase family protein [Granulosicoccus sp.]